MTYQNRAPAFSIGVPTPPLLAVLTGCRNSKTARNLTDVARRTVQLPRVVIRGRPAACSELACCGRRRPRVAIDGSNRGRRPPRVAIVVPTPPRVAIASSSKSRSAAILSTFLWLVVDVVGGGRNPFFYGLWCTGYPHPAQCEFAYPPRLHRLHNYTVLLIAQS